MEYTIKKFAHFLVLKYSNLDCMDPDLIKILGDFKKEEPTRDICNSIDLLLNCYKKFIDEISIGEFHKFAYDTLMTKAEYMQYLISGCWKLSKGKATFFEFLLACVYICKMTNILFTRYKCCKILKLAAHSLEAVYFREYSKYFDENGGFSGLSTFCKHFNDCPTSDKYEKSVDGVMTFFSLIEPERNIKVRNFKELNNGEDLNEILLSPTECKFLEDEPYLKANNRKAHFLLDWGFNPELLKKKSSDSENEIDIADFDAIPEKVFKTGLLCDYCLSKCFQYPLYSKKY